MAYPMNGGNGPNSYGKNSYYQRGAISSAKELINEAIAKSLDINILSSSNVVRITDMGCSVGPNTFVAVQNIIEAVKNKSETQRLDSRSLEFQVFLNDHVSNDFNTLFASLPPNTQYYAAGVPGSFHGRLFPKDSLHIVHTSYSLTWLSQVPKEVADKSSPAWNKGKIYYTSGRDETVKAYVDQFGRDMDSFLQSRKKEVVCGGLIILMVPGRLSSALHFQVFSNLAFDILGSCLMGMAKKGILSEEKVDSFNLPVYFASPEDLEAAVERNGYFSIERLECLPQPKTELSIPEIARTVSSHIRAGVEVLLKEHFGDEIMDELFENFSKELEKSEAFTLGRAFSLFLVLKRLAIN